MTPVSKQAKKPLGQDNARAVRWASFTPSTRSDATGHVQSAVLPTQLGGFPSKTIEFGNHFGVPARCLPQTFCRALPELVLGPLLDEKARAVLLGAPSSCSMEASDYGSRIQAAILDWGSNMGPQGPLVTGTPTLSLVSATPTG